MTLSASALGLSLTFIKDVAPKHYLLAEVLLAAWICWLISLSSMVVSLYIAKRACDVALEQLDEDCNTGEQLGKGWNTATKIINVMSGTLFLLGVIFLIIFVYTNLQGNHERSETRSETQSPPAVFTPNP